MGWKRRAAWGGLLLLTLGFSIWRRRQGHPIVQPPLCAWRFVSNFKSYNLAFPDSNSIYHVSLMHLGPGDEIRISSEALPYARYFSLQTYGIPDFVALASVRDIDIVPENGPNCYSNLTAAVNGERQGGFVLYITAHGNKGYANELRALPHRKEAGYFILFFRIYSDGVDTPPHPDIDPSVCFGPKGRHPKESPREWAWACPPEVAVKRGGSDFRTLPFCRYRRKQGIRYNDVTTPVQECPHQPNTQFSFFLPSPYYLQGKFGNHDAKYLFSCAKQPSKDTCPASPPPSSSTSEPSSPSAREKKRESAQASVLELWARVTGVLPRTAGSLYSPPYIANASDFEVRYVSISSVGRSLPYRGYETMNDRTIERFYQRSVGPGWDRSFVVWLGPPGVKRMPAEVEQDKGLFMPWGSSFGGKQVPFPGVLYRQILSRGQVVGSGPDTGGEGLEPHHSGLAGIIPQTCSAAEEEEEGVSGEGPPVCGGEGGQDLSCWLERELCCGREAPEWCFAPRYVAAKMRDYYPRIEYFLRRNDTHGAQPQPLERLGGNAGGEGALRPLVREPTAPPSGARSDAGSLLSKLWDVLNVAVWF